VPQLWLLDYRGQVSAEFGELTHQPICRAALRLSCPSSARCPNDLLPTPMACFRCLPCGWAVWNHHPRILEPRLIARCSPLLPRPPNTPGVSLSMLCPCRPGRGFWGARAARGLRKDWVTPMTEGKESLALHTATVCPERRTIHATPREHSTDGPGAQRRC
jgi:hypothetical protein